MPKPLNGDRLRAIVALFDSDQDGEVLAAVRAGRRLLAEHELKWLDVFRSPDLKLDREEDKLRAFAEVNPREYEWIKNRTDTNAFAASLWQGIRKYGSLTSRQLAAVQRNLEKDKA
jgi:hypothetical protein